jgi:hypothetical protein
MVFPGLLSDMKQRITDLEDELAEKGLDNRDVPERKLNSRRKWLCTKSLMECKDYDMLIEFYGHLREVQREEALVGCRNDRA